MHTLRSNINRKLILGLVLMFFSASVLSAAHVHSLHHSHGPDHHSHDHSFSFDHDHQAPDQKSAETLDCLAFHVTDHQQEAIEPQFNFYQSKPQDSTEALFVAEKSHSLGLPQSRAPPVIS